MPAFLRSRYASAQLGVGSLDGQCAFVMPDPNQTIFESFIDLICMIDRLSNGICNHSGELRLLSPKHVIARCRHCVLNDERMRVWHDGCLDSPQMLLTVKMMINLALNNTTRTLQGLESARVVNHGSREIDQVSRGHWRWRLWYVPSSGSKPSLC